MKYLLAHDIGTSGNKASLFTVDGELIKSTVISYDVDYGEGGKAEQNPQEVLIPMHGSFYVRKKSERQKSWESVHGK